MGMANFRSKNDEFSNSSISVRSPHASPDLSSSMSDLPLKAKSAPEKLDAVKIKMPSIKPKNFSQLGRIVNEDTLTLELEDIEQYLEHKDENHPLKDDEQYTPFIIYLNSKFTRQVRNNQRLRRAKSIGGVVALVIFVAIVFFL